jgi:4-amino-4-deoxy-L-arabinose transferase-like glycosyltransferase
MFSAFHSASYPWLQQVLRRRAWILVGLTILFVVVVRVRLREMPLERDEGEYAYAGQLILQGIPPYREVYNMKLPGTYAAYALIMAVFGQTPSGIHFGLALVNAASIVLMFLLGRKLLDDIAGVAAAVAFALLSLSPSVLGLAGHATHFVALAALGGILLLLRACEPEVGGGRPGFLFPSARFFASGLLFGLAFLMKQHGLFFGVFGTAYLLRTRIGQWLAGELVEVPITPAPSDEERGTAKAGRGRSVLIPARLGRLKAELWPPGRLKAEIRRFSTDLGLFALGWLLPYGLTCLVLWGAGAFSPFVFWTISYAGKYASAIPLVNGPDLLRASLNAVVGPNLVLWVLPWVGAVLMWWEERLDHRSQRSTVGGSNAVSPDPSFSPEERAEGPRSEIRSARFFLTTLLFCSVASVSVGMYFREHYFILLLPALALLTGVAVSRGVHLLKHDQTIELFLALPILGLFVIALGAALIGNGSIWLGMTPLEAMRSVCGTTLFSEVVKAADYIKSNAAPDARVAVLGSEPEIYFYSRRRSATGYIYMYPLMEEQSFASKMQAELIAEIERARPEFVVYVDDDFSWLPRPNSERKVFEWWQNYWAKNLDLVMTLEFEEGLERGADADSMARRRAARATRNHILILKRRQ